MKGSRWILGCLSLVLIAGVVGCRAPSPTPTPTPTPSPTPKAEVPFTIGVVPEQLKGFSIAGQTIVYLVTYADSGDAGGEGIVLQAVAEGATVRIVEPGIGPGEVGEIEVVPAAGSVGKTVQVTVTGIRGSLKSEKSLSFEVIEGEDDRRETALEYQGRFIRWLAEKHPELGITEATEWTGTMVSPQWLIVSHYLFFSDEWEMHIEWHIMIAPYDWVRIDLRRRGKEVLPSQAFEISSRSSDADPIVIDFPAEPWR